MRDKGRKECYGICKSLEGMSFLMLMMREGWSSIDDMTGLRRNERVKVLALFLYFFLFTVIYFMLK